MMTLPSSSIAATPEPLSSRPPVLVTVSQCAPTTSTLSSGEPHLRPGSTPMMLVPGNSPEPWRWTNCRALDYSIHKWLCLIKYLLWVFLKSWFSFKVIVEQCLPENLCSSQETQDTKFSPDVCSNVLFQFWSSPLKINDFLNGVNRNIYGLPYQIDGFGGK